MRLETALIGSYPKPVRIAKIISKKNNGKISEEKYLDQIFDFMNNFFDMMKSFNVDFTTDSMIEWDDIADLTYSFLTNVKKGSLTRFFDNNFYYRQIVINEKLKYKEDNTYIKYFEKAKELARSYNFKLKAVILGPLTFLKLSENHYYKNEEELMKDYALIVNSLLKNIKSDVVEIHEPSIFQKGIKKDLLNTLLEIYYIMLENIKAETHLLTYFDINFDRLENYMKLPVSVYGFDVTESNKNRLGRLYQFLKGKQVYFGILDSRTTKMEKIVTIKRIVSTASEKGIERLILGNSSFNDFIPEIIVQKKFKLLQKAKEMILNG
ncbi:5-methyltetrahydropteroyltriglutamate--homocysteine methyltransferase [Sulfolobus sp. S-194]|uniref:5-methyltetrahydropteroyltriglutamate-- homocysteine methyltransferase n=1 Tax=Sulfolobus sp. S-194 TaxID=2512240 RepID=UPI0014371E6D|nr:5-methyltetrahydropteroyltriglutamate--homocysteine methyltransferase [Sulfolobus sp. S-194]QIW23235.1 5-methyltetrahydropteroyltriglutamate--homocysteine methyltransferase [Sulfolobus sp. S-194]